MGNRFSTGCWFVVAVLASGCGPRFFPDGGTPDAGPNICVPGQPACLGNQAGICNAAGNGLLPGTTSCAASSLICVAGECVFCVPNATYCEGLVVSQCNTDGSAATPIETCDGTMGETCDDSTGLAGCFNACAIAEMTRSNVGCTYFAVDLDNARVTDASGGILDAAAQEFAVVISNPSLLTANVTVVINNGPAGGTVSTAVVDSAVVPPRGLHTFRLGDRPIDGGGDTINGLSGSRLTSNAFRITSTAPIVAYQFNPLDNTGTVFSNDASLLIPVTAMDSNYFILGWPQTIAETADMNTNFGAHLRSTLTVVGVAPATSVTITLPGSVAVPNVPGNDYSIPAGGSLMVTLGEFDVINLETHDFRADFTGTTVVATAAVGVFSGSEAADVPAWTTLAPASCPFGGTPDPVNGLCCMNGSTPDALGMCNDGTQAIGAYAGDRRCCGDHLEEMLPPLNAIGNRYIAARTPSRGGPLMEPDYWRVMAVTENTTVTTSLPPPDNQFTLFTGGYRDLVSVSDFIIEATEPVLVGQFVASQENTGIPFTEPGGDPAFILPPPIDQWRDSYVFLAPDAYAFDFMILSMPQGIFVTFDGGPLPAGCSITTGVGVVQGLTYDTARCPITDGVHSLEADLPIGVVVYGFDAFVSYGYAGGTDLRAINIL